MSGSAPVASVTSSAEGKRTLISELNGAPLPDGRKTSVWLSIVVQSPFTEGTTVGSAPPNTRATGAEKVSLIGESGSARPLRRADASTTGRSDLGNQVNGRGRRASPTVARPS